MTIAPSVPAALLGSPSSLPSEAALDAGVHLSENLTGGVFVNQTAAFSDLHGTGANPAATASLTDDYYVTGRFFALQSRHHVPAPEGA